MKNQKPFWMGMILLAGFLASVAFLACHEIENEGPAPIPITLNLKLPDAAGKEINQSKAQPRMVTAAMGLVKGMAATNTLQLKISLTNPTEVFMRNDIPLTGAKTITVNLVAASGDNRALSVEMYEVPTSEPDNVFPASWAGMTVPLVLNLQGASVTANVNLNWGSTYTTVSGGYTVIVQSPIPQTLMFGATCPNQNFRASITDDDWGLTFPDVLADLWWGGSYSMAIKLFGFPRNHNYTIRFYHYTAGFAANFSVLTSGPVVSTPNVISFTGYQPLAVNFLPSSLGTVIQATFHSLDLALTGGFGDPEISAIQQGATWNTCLGSTMGSSPNIWYEFNAPAPPSCNIVLNAWDCKGNNATGQMTVNISP